MNHSQLCQKDVLVGASLVRGSFLDQSLSSMKPSWRHDLRDLLLVLAVVETVNGRCLGVAPTFTEAGASNLHFVSTKSANMFHPSSARLLQVQGGCPISILRTLPSHKQSCSSPLFDIPRSALTAGRRGRNHPQSSAVHPQSCSNLSFCPSLWESGSTNDDSGHQNSVSCDKIEEKAFLQVEDTALLNFSWTRAPRRRSSSSFRTKNSVKQSALISQPAYLSQNLRKKTYILFTFQNHLFQNVFFFSKN